MFLIFLAREIEDFSRNYMALKLEVYKQNLSPILKFLEQAYQVVCLGPR